LYYFQHKNAVAKCKQKKLAVFNNIQAGYQDYKKDVAEVIISNRVFPLIIGDSFEIS